MGLHRDRWESGRQYESYMGRWSREVAVEFLRWISAPEGSAWLDLGCGTGVLSSLILEQTSPSEVLAIDPSEGFIAFAKEQIVDPRINFRVGNALSLPSPSEALDVVVSGLVLNFLPDVGASPNEMRRVTRAHGMVAGYVWDYAGGMGMLRHFWDAAAALDPAAGELDEGNRFPLCDPDRLEGAFSGAGLRDVEVRAIDVATVFESFDDYWEPFFSGVGPAPGYVSSLDQGMQSNLENRLRAALPVEADGSIELAARAFAVRGAR